MYDNLTDYEIRFMKRLEAEFRVEFGIINSIIDLYKYEKAFNIANTKKTEKLIWEVLLSMKKQSQNYGNRISDRDLEYAFNIIKKELNRERKKTYPEYALCPEDTLEITEYFLKMNERFKKYNYKIFIKKALRNIGIPNECLESDAFIINLVTLLEEQIKDLLPDESNLDEGYLSNYKNIEEYLTRMFREYLVVRETGREISITIRELRALDEEVIPSQYDALNYIQAKCRNMKDFSINTHTLTFNKANKTLSVFQSNSSYAYDYRNNSYIINTDTRVVVYDKFSRMIMDFGNTSVDVQEIYHFKFPNTNHQTSSYRLEVLPNNKCHYIQIEDGITILETYDLDLGYDTTTIDFRYMKQFWGSESEVAAFKYDNLIAECYLGDDHLEYLRSKKIPYLFHESDDMSLGTSYCFSIENMWRVIEKQVEDAHGNVLFRKKKGGY